MSCPGPIRAFTVTNARTRVPYLFAAFEMKQWCGAAQAQMADREMDRMGTLLGELDSAHNLAEANSEVVRVATWAAAQAGAHRPD